MLLTKVMSTERPAEVSYMPLNDGTFEVRLRKNITVETDDAGYASEEEATVNTSHFVYDEVMFITTEAREKIEANFDTWFNFGTTWKQESDNPLEAAVNELRKENQYLSAAINDIGEMLAALLGG